MTIRNHGNIKQLKDEQRACSKRLHYIKIISKIKNAEKQKNAAVAVVAVIADHGEPSTERSVRGAPFLNFIMTTHAEARRRIIAYCLLLHQVDQKNFACRNRCTMTNIPLRVSSTTVI